MLSAENKKLRRNLGAKTSDIRLKKLRIVIYVQQIFTS
jgi:hypothetical protein